MSAAPLPIVAEPARQMLLGLTGHAGAGKDTVAAVLQAGGWHRTAFADALRVEVAAAWAIDMGLLNDRRHKEHPTPQLAAGMAASTTWHRWCAAQGISLAQARSPRWVLQQWGTYRRDTSPSYWVQHVAYWVQHQRHHHGHRYLVVTDVRFQNEAQALRQLGGLVVRVHRLNHNPLAPDTAAHVSEQHTAIPADGDIHNDGSLADLAAETWRVVQALPARTPPEIYPHA